MDQALVPQPDGYYTIEGSQTLWLKIQLERQTALVISAAHTTFFKNQNWSIRMWISNVPNGVSVTREPVISRSFVNPLKNPVRFGLYDHVYPMVPEVPDAIWLQPGSVDVTYYVNIRNMENKSNAFFMKVDTLYV
jgi:hypothetical protein